MVRVAINGFGRIGRLAFRAMAMHYGDNLEIVAVNTSGSMPASDWMHLVKYDTTYKLFPLEMSAEDVKKPKEATDEDPLIGHISVNGKKVAILAQRDPEKLPWKQYEVDVVIESTGIFVDKKGAEKHIAAGAKKVVISAPAKGEGVATYVRGVNETGQETVISNASCTTNCISPVAQVVHEHFGIQKAMMTTVHAFTDDQRVQDNSHSDLRRARSASQNIIPTTTGAAVATTDVIPELKGLFDGMAIRVPVACGSLSDITFLTKKQTTIEEVNETFKKAAASERYQGIMTTTEDPVVSSDIIGQTYSAIVDLNFTNVVDGDLVKVMAWYDNEWGYTNRLVEQVLVAGGL